jgi:hypothetical protein
MYLMMIALAQKGFQVSVGPDMSGPYIAAIVKARHASPIVRAGFEIAGTPY